MGGLAPFKALGWLGWKCFGLRAAASWSSWRLCRALLWAASSRCRPDQQGRSEGGGASAGARHGAPCLPIAVLHAVLGASGSKSSNASIRLRHDQAATSPVRILGGAAVAAAAQEP